MPSDPDPEFVAAWRRMWTVAHRAIEANAFTRADWAELVRKQSALGRQDARFADLQACASLGRALGFLTPETLTATLSAAIESRALPPPPVVVKLFSADQPRAPAGGSDGGQWTSGGGGAGAGGGKSGGGSGSGGGGGATSRGEAGKAGSGISGSGARASGAQPTKRTWTDKPPDGMPSETWKSHYDKSPWDGGKVTDPERAKLQENLIHEAMGNVKPSPPGERIAIMTMGAPASGKSSMLAGIDRSKFVVSDSDEIKTRLPEYQKATENPDATYKGAAAMAHVESSDIADRITDRAVAQGKNVIIDGTGSNEKYFVDKIKQLHDAGYKVHVAMPHLDEEEGIRRLKDRADRTGRMVPEEFARAAYKKIPSNFEKIAGQADSFALYDANRGGAPVKVWSKDLNGKVTEHDPAFVRDFRAKHGHDEGT